MQLVLAGFERPQVEARFEHPQGEARDPLILEVSACCQPPGWQGGTLPPKMMSWCDGPDVETSQRSDVITLRMLYGDALVYSQNYGFEAIFTIEFANKNTVLPHDNVTPSPTSGDIHWLGLPQ